MDFKKEIPSEADLIARLREGSVEAFDQLYNLYYRRIYGYCLSFTKSRKDTEDIVQEVFIKLWLTREDINTTKSVGNYLFSIAHNKLISAFRSNIYSPHFEDYLDYCDTLGREDCCMVEYKEFVMAVEKGISSLPPMQQRIVRLSKFANMSNQDIANLFNISVQTVKNQLVTALKKIRSHLDSKQFMILLISIILSSD